MILDVQVEQLIFIQTGKNKRQRDCGSHAVVLIEYNTDVKEIKIKNSDKI